MDQIQAVKTKTCAELNTTAHIPQLVSNPLLFTVDRLVKTCSRHFSASSPSHPVQRIKSSSTHAKVIFKGRLCARERQVLIGEEGRGEGSHHGWPAVSCRCGCCAHLRGDEAVDTSAGERAVHLWVMTHHCKWSGVGQRSPQCRSCTHTF